MREFFLGLLVLLLAGVLYWALSGRKVENFLNPLEPFFEGAVQPRPTPSVTPSPRVSGRFSVASFNVHFGYEAEKIAPTLVANGMGEADIILLQESNETTAVKVSRALHMAYAYYPAAVHPTSKDLFGVAILSRWPILAHRKILLPDKSYFDAARKAGIVAVINVDGVPIKVVSVHLQSGMLESGYKDQIKSLVECVTEDDCHNDGHAKALPESRATVFGGDFNTWRGSLVEPLMSRMDKASMKRVGGIESTFSKDMSKEPKTRYTFDYFFATPGIVAGPGRVGTDRTGSDHYPIAADFLLPRQ
ncbi:MAG: endonuclease/exonuclease/phosphatase family protein [Vicinamibacteria bacterium]